MTKIQQLQERVTESEAQLESIRKDKARADTSSDLPRRRELRRAEAEAEEDLAMLKADLAKELNWERSPERAAEIALAARESAAAEAAYAAVESLWHERSLLLAKAAGIGVQIAERHGQISKLASSAIQAVYSRPQDMPIRMDRARMILPLAQADTNLMSLAIGTGLEAVMTSVPGGRTASQEYLVPNQWSRSNVSVDEAISAMRREFTARMSDMIPAALQ